MRTGKVKESIWKRSVLRQLHKENRDGRLAPGNGTGVFPVPGINEERKAKGFSKGDERIFCYIDSVEGWTLAPERAIYKAVNALVAAGAEPLSAAVTVLMPDTVQENDLKGLIKQLNAFCFAENVSLDVGYTTVSPFVNNLILSVNAAGIRKRGAAKAGKNVKAGMDLVVAGTVGREGAAMIAIEKEEQLLSRYSSSYVNEAKRLYDKGIMRNSARILEENGAVVIYHFSEGGIFAGFWELAAACKVGLDIDLKSIPIKQHTIEVCEYFNLNPYMLRSGGCLLAVCEDGEETVRMLRQAGEKAAVVGKITDSNDRIIRYDDEIRFLEPPKPDEYYKTIQN